MSFWYSLIMQTITTNELKKGDKVTLKCGWDAVLEDNKKGNIRLATVHGIYTEMGSIYAHDIVAAYPQAGGRFLVVPSASQKKLGKTISSLF